METKSASQKYRVQLDFTPEAFEELEALKSQVQASSRADTVRYAMRVLRWVMEQVSEGGKIQVNRGGKVSEVVFPFLPSTALRDLFGRLRKGAVRRAEDELRIRDLEQGGSEPLSR